MIRSAVLIVALTTQAIAAEPPLWILIGLDAHMGPTITYRDTARDADIHVDEGLPTGRISDRGGEHARRRQHLGVRLELGLLRRQVGREGFREGRPFGVGRLFIPVLDRGALHRTSRLRGVELPVALFDAASPLVPGNDDTDMVRASPLARSGDFLLRLAGCQGKDLIPEGRRGALAAS
jgi:hypothetical protein